MPTEVAPAKTNTLKRYFIGFSTQNSLGNGVRTVYDIDLIKIDLMNTFNTRVGERVMRPDFGCKLWDYLMEPMTPPLRDQIIEEAVRVCSLDSRVTVQNVSVFQVEQGFQVQIILQFLPWLVVDTFAVTFENNNAVYYSGITTRLDSQ